MNAIEEIKTAQQAKLIDEDGESVSLQLAKPLTSEQIDSFQAKIGLPLPRELQELLAFCSGIDGCLDVIDFTGENAGFEMEEIFPKGLSIATDGFGNAWVLDITPETGNVAPVFFACHDAPVILYQSPDLASFLAEVFRMNTPPHKSLVDDVHEDRLFDVWRKNPGVIPQMEAAASSDPVLKAFGSSLPEHFQVIDLRKAQQGMGFSWGRYGPRTEIRRHGYEKIFAYAKPPKTGLFAKLFGR
jgi:cell wall assembly regulator SMI1